MQNFIQNKKKKKTKNKNQTNVNVFCKPEEILSRQKKEKKKKHKVEKDKKLAIGWRRATWRYAVCKDKGICVIYCPHHIFSLVFLLEDKIL